MKVLTIGTGVIGTIYSWILAQQGCNVTHYVRNGKSSQINSDIKIDILDKRKGHKTRYNSTYHYNLIETLDPDNNYDYIIIAVRVRQLEALLQDIKGRTGNACCVIFTGQWRDVEWIEAYLPKGGFVFSDPIAGGRFYGDTLVAALNNKLPLGEVGESRSERLLALGEQFEHARIKPVYHKHIVHWHWLQYALNAAMWGALVRAGSVVAAAGDKRLVGLVLRATTEAIQVCERRGVDLDEFPEVKTYTNLGGFKTWVMRAGFKWMMKHSEYHRRCSLHGLDDPKEIKLFYNAVLETGQEMGLPMTAYREFQKDIDALELFVEN